MSHRAKTRANFSTEAEANVLVACRRACAFCWGFNADASIKHGQLAHVDRNRSNNEESNAAFLCLEHHDAYDLNPSQSKRLTKSELIRYRTSLLKHQKKTLVWTDTKMHTTRQTKKRANRVSLDVYKARIPIYRTAVEFLRAVAKDLRPSIEVILQFARDTEEALFLYDETIADYLALLFRKALQIHTVDLMREGGHRPPENLSELIKEHTELALWFTEQYDVLRSRFAPYLGLANYSNSRTGGLTHTQTLRN